MTVAVRRRCASPAEARHLLASVRADTPEWVALGVEGRELTIRLKAATASSARATLEDLLACLRAAERTVGLSEAGADAPDRKNG